MPSRTGVAVRDCERLVLHQPVLAVLLLPPGVLLPVLLLLLLLNPRHPHLRPPNPQRSQRRQGHIFLPLFLFSSFRCRIPRKRRPVDRDLFVWPQGADRTLPWGRGRVKSFPGGRNEGSVVFGVGGGEGDHDGRGVAETDRFGFPSSGRDGAAAGEGGVVLLRWGCAGPGREVGEGDLWLGDGRGGEDRGGSEGGLLLSLLRGR